MPPPPKKPRILIVEDEAIVARDIQQQVVELGYEVAAHATQGEKAIVLAGQFQPDLVLMDVQLAGAIDGIAAARAIRDQFSIPVVYLTAFAEDETIARALLTDPFGYITKPFSERELRTVIELGLYKHRMEKMLQQSEERLRLVLLGSNDGIWDRDLVKQEVFYNARWWEILGYAPNELPANAQLWQSLLHPEDRNRATEFMTAVQRNGVRNYEIEVRLRHKAGHYIPVLSRGIIVRDQNGQAIRMAGTNTDLTPRKQSEAKLQHRTDFLASLAQIIRALLTHRELDELVSATVQHAAQNFNAVEAILMLRAGEFLVTRATWSHTAGAIPKDAILTKDESDPAWMAFSIGRPFQTQVTEGSPGQTRHSFAPVGAAVLHVPILLGSECLGVLGIIRPAPNFSDEEVTEASQLADALALILHNAQLLAATREDLRRREQAEQKNKESEARITSVINSAMDAIITFDARRQILIFNPAAETMFRLPRSQAIGLPLERFIPARLRANYRRFIEEFPIAHLSSKPMMLDRAIVALRADGGEFPIEASISHTMLGGETLFTVILRDITARERAEREKVAIETQLRQSQKLEGIGQLAGGVAHDFNNLLTAILGNATLLQDSRQLSSSQVEMLQQISQAGNRAASLTRQLLLFSRREEPVHRDLDLNIITDEMLKMLRRILGEAIELQVNLSVQPLFVQADAGMLDQVLLNLSVNARDAMPKGGRLTIATESAVFEQNDDASGLIEWIGPQRQRRTGAVIPESSTPTAQSPATQARAGEFACLSVTDEGCGMSAELIARIFEPFFTTKEAGHGTGLGLATVYGIVQLHQGWIQVESAPGAGSSFRIYLPRLAPRASVAKPLVKPEALFQGHGETIMIVEDEASVRSVLRIWLERVGYRVLECASGATAIELWAKHRSEVVLLITDMVMPGAISGVLLAQKLLKDRPDLKIIITSGYSATLNQDRKKFEVEIDFIPKPFMKDQLLAVVRASLDRKNIPRK